MSELKAYRFLGQDEVWPDANLGSDYYLKSEATMIVNYCPMCGRKLNKQRG